MLEVNQLIGFGAGGASEITFVGYATSDEGAGTSVSLTSLTGGIGSAPAAGDFVLALQTRQTTSNVDYAPSGYTEILDLYRDTPNTADPTLGVHYKFMTSTPDTTFTKSSSNDALFALVFRGVNAATPQDATATSTTAVEDPNCRAPAITTVTAGAFVVIVGSMHETNSVPPTAAAPSGYTATTVLDINAGDMDFIACFKKVDVPGTETPGIFATQECDWAVGTIALRPA